MSLGERQEFAYAQRRMDASSVRHGCRRSLVVALSLRDRKREGTSGVIARLRRFDRSMSPVDRATCRGATGRPSQKPLPHSVSSGDHPLTTAAVRHFWANSDGRGVHPTGRPFSAARPTVRVATTRGYQRLPRIGSRRGAAGVLSTRLEQDRDCRPCGTHRSSVGLRGRSSSSLDAASVQ